MMKRIAPIVVITLTALAGPLAAQGTSLGFRGGLTSTNVSIEGDPEDTPDTNSISGIVLGGYVQFPLGGSLSLQTGVNYVQKGAELDFVEEVGNLNLDYLDIPLLGVLSFPTSGPLGVRVMGGPVVSFEMSCEVLNPEIEVTMDCPDAEVETKSIDFGLQVGGGLTFDIQQVASLFFDVGYQLGLANIADDAGPDESAKNRALLFSVGVDFPLSY